MWTDRLHLKINKTISICGGILAVLFCNFTTWLWGNLAVYVYSYFHLKKNTGGNHINAPWLISILDATWKIGAIMAGIFISNQCLSRRQTLVLGMVLFNVGLFLSYFVVLQTNLDLLNLSIGVINGFGDGLMSTATLICLMDWTLDSQIGLITALVTGSKNLGAIITNQFVTHYINPDDLSPDLQVGPTRYFSQKDILQRVPMVFIFYGSASTFAHIMIAFCLMKTKPPEKQTFIYETNEECTTEGDIDLMVSNKRQYDLESVGSKFSPSKNNDVNTSTIQFQKFHLRDLLKRKSFYSLWLSFLFLSPGFIMPLNYYKIFGQEWIKNDYFLTDLGTAISIAVFFARLFWVFIIDRFGIKTTLLSLSVGISIMSNFYYFTPQVDQWLLYFCCSLVYLSVSSGIVQSYTAAVIKLFGKEHFAIHYGLLFTAYFISNLSLPPLIIWILSHDGWFQLFFGTGVVSFLALLLVILFLEKC